MADGIDLVTGAFGFVGSHVARELLAAGRSVLGTDTAAALSDTKRRQLMRQCGLDLEHPRLSLVASDLLAPDSLAPLFAPPPQRIFHTASLYDYSASLEQLRRINVDGTRNLLAHALNAKLDRFIHWSTCGVFGKPLIRGRDGRQTVPFSETSSSPKNASADAHEPVGTHLVNEYSISKWEQEQMLWQAHREHGLPLTVVRPAPVYGPGSSYGYGGIIIAVAQGIVRALPRDARNFITTSVHVDDIARFACFIADRPEGLGEDYNVIDNSVISYQEFTHYIALLVGRRIWDVPLLTMPMMRPVAMQAAKLWTWLERRYGVRRMRVFEVQSTTYIASSYWISNRKSLATGFRYRYPDVREGLQDTVAWMRDVGWL